MRFYKLALLKAYFEKGYAMLSYPKYVLFLMGLGDVIANDGDYNRVLIIGFLVGLACFLLGWICYKYNFVDAEIEVGNRFNPFVKEMRNEFKNGKV